MDEEIKPLTWEQRFILLALFLVPILTVTGIIWGIYSVIKTPEYEDLYPMQGILVYKKRPSNGRHDYYLKVNIDGEEFAFSVRPPFALAYPKLQVGDQMNMLVKRKKNVKTKTQRIYELEVNGEMLVTYDRAVAPNSDDRFAKKTSFVLFGIILFFILMRAIAK